MFKNVTIWRYDGNYNMTEIAAIQNITSHHLQLKQKHRILAKHWLIHPKCATYLKLMLVAHEMVQTPSMPHRHFQFLVKIQRENGVLLVEGHDNNEAGKFEYLLKSYILNYFYFISGANLWICRTNLRKCVCTFQKQPLEVFYKKKGS